MNRNRSRQERRTAKKIKPAIQDILRAIVDYIKDRDVLKELAGHASKRTDLTKVRLQKKSPRENYEELPADVKNKIDSLFGALELTPLWQGLQTLWEDANIDIFNQSAQQALRGFGFDIRFVLRNPMVLREIASRANLLAEGSVRDQFETIKWHIANDFYNERKSLDQVSKHLTEVVRDLGTARAELIVRTETGTYIEQANYEVAERIGVERKFWIYSRDDRIRRGHLETGERYNRENTIKMEELFDVPLYKIVGGVDVLVGIEQMAHPLDYKNGASAGNIVECRCDFGTAVDPDSKLDVWAGE